MGRRMLGKDNYLELQEQLFFHLAGPLLRFPTHTRAKQTDGVTQPGEDSRTQLLPQSFCTGSRLALLTVGALVAAQGDSSWG